MLKNTLLLSFLLLGWLPLISQEIPKGFPRQDYKFSAQIKKELTQEELRSARASWHYSYIGKYQKAMDTYPDVDTRHGFDQISEEDSLHFLTFTAANAIDYILKRAQKEQIIIINEAHHKPLHRVFTRQLLFGLYETGFNYFGLECLASNVIDPQIDWLLMDSVLVDRGYPFQSYFTGTYTTEPQMGHLMRQGIKVGFQLFAYEKYKKGDRELMQAQNIKRILDKDPNARILIHCGWDHLLEDTIQTSGKLKWMAWHLKQLTGIDPFTINQDFLTEGKKGKESRLYNMINETESSVFLNEEGDAFYGPQNWKKFDILVYHPRSQYRNNRPDWLYNLEGNQLFEIEKSQIKIDYPVIVKAYHPKERPEATPWDVIELIDENDQTALVLPKGSYVLKLFNLEGSTQELNIEVK